MSGITYREVNPLKAQQEADNRLAAVRRAIDFSQAALASTSLDHLYFFLTNDIRALLDFDRCSLVTHIGGKSKLVAVNEQPLLETKAKFHTEITELAADIKSVKQGILLPRNQPPENILEQGLSEDVLKSLQSFMEFSGSSYLALVPLQHGTETAAHLLIEWFEDNMPNRAALANLMKLGPYFGTAIAEKWLLNKRPGVRALISTDPDSVKGGVPKYVKWAGIAVAAIVLLGVLFFAIPFTRHVGGEASIIPYKRHMAFCKIEGLIDKVLVHEGDRVDKDQVVAVMDPKDLDYKIKTAQSEYDLLSEKLMVLRNMADEDPKNLAESQLVKLERNSAWLDLNYYKWQKSFLDLRTPVEGIVITKDVETLVGKKFQAGEPFCEIAAPGDLWLEIFVPEDRISRVETGQKLRVYLNNEPLTGRELTVKEIAPAAEANERLGNIYRVRAPFPEAHEIARVGMKGIAKIDTGQTNLWSIVTQRLVAFWNKMSIYF
jgi:hypothetical protein